MRMTGLIFTAALLLAGTAQAQTTYTAQDDGVAAGVAAPNSAAASTDFLAAAATYGPVTTVNFDSSPTGFAPVYSFPGLTIAITAPDVGNGFTGISDTSITPTNLYGFDQSAGGTGKWFGFPLGDATFTFAKPTNSFGFYLSGTQDVFGADLSVTIDGIVYQAPINGETGGAGYFGYTSDTAFSTVNIFRSGGDAWGIDNVSYNYTATAAVPEPATWAMMIGGFGLVGGTLRRRRVATAMLARA